MATTSQRLAALEAWKTAHTSGHVLSGHKHDLQAHDHPASTHNHDVAYAAKTHTHAEPVPEPVPPPPPPPTGTLPPERELPPGGSLPAVPSRPAKLVTYTDPFGTKGRIIGDTGQRHAYSKTQPWNADETLLQLAYGGILVDGRTFQRVGSIGNPGNFQWHPTQPRKGYSAQNGDPRLYEWDLATLASPRTTILRTFDRPISIGRGEGGIADDGTLALISADGASACTWNVATNTGSPWFPTGGSPDSVTMSRDGRFLVAVFEGSHVQAWNRDGSGSHRVRVGARHGDTQVSTDGRQVWVQASGEMHDLSRTDGPMTPLFTGPNAFSPVHVSGRGPHGEALFSVYDTSASAGKPGNDTLCSVKLDGSGTVRIYGYAWRRGSSYETQPQAVPSRDGRRVLTATDWGNSGTWALVLGISL